MPCRWRFGMCLSHLIYTVQPCLIHTCHAMLRPCRSSQGHGTARPSRQPVGCLLAFGFFRLTHGVPRSTLPEAYQSQMQVASVKPNSFVMDEEKSGSNTLQKKDDPLNCWISGSDISGYHADFHEGHGTIWAWHGHCMLCVNRPWRNRANSIRIRDI